MIGLRHLHPHSHEQEKLGLDKDHIIVDKQDWEIAIKVLQNNPEVAKEIMEKIDQERIKEYATKANR